jgi:hypothetical protein
MKTREGGKLNDTDHLSLVKSGKEKSNATDPIIGFNDPNDPFIFFIHDQKLKEKAESIVETKRKELVSPLINPISWMKRPPPSDKEALEVLVFDAAHMFCVLCPIIAVILFFSKVLIDTTFGYVRISKFYFDSFATFLLLYGVHFLIIKWYLHLEKINKFFALFLAKIIPVFIAFTSSVNVFIATK